VVSAIAALGVALAGWLSLVVSAILAMGADPDWQIAVALGCAGAAAALGLCFAIYALRLGGGAVLEVVAISAAGAGAFLAILVAVFALSIHW